MKKLVILILLLAITSTAHAGFVILDGEGNSSIDLMSLPGLTGSLTLYVQYTDTDCMMMDVEVDADLGATISNGVLLGNANTYYDGIVTPGPTGMQMEFLQGWDDSVTTFPANTNLCSFVVSWSNINPSDLPITVNGHGYAYPGGMYPAIYPNIPPYLIGVPEPVTVVLLGLGGLVLCCRKPQP